MKLLVWFHAAWSVLPHFHTQCPDIGCRYNKPEIWVTENGVCSPGESDVSMEEALKDTFRVDFYR